MAEEAMNPEIKAAWLSALRSGEYKQGRIYLNNNGKYCCLGVLIDISRPDQWKDSDDGSWKEFEGIACYFPDEISKDLGLDPVTVSKLIGMNDTLLNSFTEIADYIERSVP